MEDTAGAALQRWRLLIAYDGARLPRLRRPARGPDGGRRAAPGPRAHRPPERAAADHLRRPHRRRGPRTRPGRPRRPAARPLRRRRPGPGHQPPAGARRWSCAAPNRSGPTSTPAARPPAAPTGTWSGTRRRPTPCWRRSPGTCVTPSTWGPCAPRPTSCSGSHDFRSFCRRPPGTDAARPIVRRVTTRPLERRRRAGGADADGGRGGPGCCASRSPPAPSATRWCAPWWRASCRSAGAGERRRPAGAPAGGDAPSHGRSGAGPGPLPGLGRLRRPDRGGGLPPLTRGTILVRRLAGPP